VLIIGTSLTAGLGLDPDSAYPAVLQRTADSAGVRVRFDAAGVSGETSAGALRRAEWLLREPPAMVMIETGANDGLRGLDPDATAANLRGIVALVRTRAPGAVVIIAQMESPPNMGQEYTRRFHALFGEVANETGSRLLPFLLDGVAGVPAMNQEDGIHPTAAGARRAAQNAWATLGPLLGRLEKSG
jgi:acyl-CoA thioesterase-1